MPSNASIDQILNTKEKKLAMFQNILLVAIADRYLDDQESDFLVSLGNQLKLTEADTLPISDNLADLKFIIPQSDMQKTLELEMLVKMMLQDGEMETREYDLCMEYTRQIGFAKEQLDAAISQNRY